MPPHASGISMPSRPSAPISRSKSVGQRASSHAAGARGAISFCANSRQSPTRSRSASVSVKSTAESYWTDRYNSLGAARRTARHAYERDAAPVRGTFRGHARSMCEPTVDQQLTLSGSRGACLQLELRTGLELRLALVRARREHALRRGDGLANLRDCLRRTGGDLDRALHGESRVAR